MAKKDFGDFATSVMGMYQQNQQRKFDNKLKQDTLNFNVSQALFNQRQQEIQNKQFARQMDLKEQVAKDAQGNIVKDQNWRSGAETISDPTLAGLLGVETGTAIPRSQWSSLVNMAMAKDKNELTKEQLAQQGKQIDYTTKGPRDVNPAILKMFNLPEGTKLTDAEMNILASRAIYEDTLEKETEKRQAITQDEMLKAPVSVPLFQTNELDDINIQEDEVRKSASGMLQYLNMAGPNNITPLQTLTARAEKDSADLQVNDTVTQLENIVKTMNMPGMRTGNIIPGLFGDSTEGEKNQIKDMALQSLQQLYKAKGMKRDDILKKIKVLRKKQTKNVNLNPGY